MQAKLKQGKASFKRTFKVNCCGNVQMRTIKKYENERLESIDIWWWRKITRTSWIESLRNDTVLQQI